jgi:hypothetical protein
MVVLNHLSPSRGISVVAEMLVHQFSSPVVQFSPCMHHKSWKKLMSLPDGSPAISERI